MAFNVLTGDLFMQNDGSIVCDADGDVVEYLLTLKTWHPFLSSCYCAAA